MLFKEMFLLSMWCEAHPLHMVDQHPVTLTSTYTCHASLKTSDSDSDIMITNWAVALGSNVGVRDGSEAFLSSISEAFLKSANIEGNKTFGSNLVIIEGNHVISARQQPSHNWEATL